MGILAAVMLASFAIAALVAARLQRRITQPILDVTDVARQVVERRDFTLRATATTEDEIGYLGQSIEDSAWLHGLQRIQVEGLLRWALPHAAAWRRERFIRLTREPGHETPLPERKRVA